jgi:hypothetical protein
MELGLSLGNCLTARRACGNSVGRVHYLGDLLGRFAGQFSIQNYAFALSS